MLDVNWNTVMWMGWRHAARLMSLAAVLILTLATILPPLTASPYVPSAPEVRQSGTGDAEKRLAFATLEETPQDASESCEGEESDPRALGGIPENEHETKLVIAGPAGLSSLSGAHLVWDKDFAEHPVVSPCDGHFTPPKRPPNVA